MTPIATAFLCGFQPVPSHPAHVQQTSTQRMALPGDELEVRDLAGLPNRAESDHFVLWWGDDADLVLGFDELLLRDLELAWEAQVEELGWVRPVGSEAFKVNAYVANSHEDAPTIDFNGAYVTLDRDGLPFVAFAPSVVQGYAWDDQAAINIVQHEFNHLVQLGEPGLYETDRGDFYFEASANWMAAQTTGDTDEYIEWGQYLLQPHFSVHAFGALNDEEDRRSRRQYLAGMFVQFLADRYGVDLIRQSWDEAGAAENPLPWLDAAIDDTLEEAFVEFAVSHAVGDHDLATLYAWGASRSLGDTPAEAVAVWLPPEGGSGDAVGPQRPEGMAWSRLVWDPPFDATARFTFDAVDGSRGSTPDFVNVAVVERQGAFERVPFTDTVELEVSRGDVVHFVLVSVPEEYVDNERFGFSYALEVDEERQGCGCASGGSEGSWVSWLSRRRT